MEEHVLVRALRARSTDALASVYDRYGPQLFDYCHALVRDRDTAASVLHDTLLAAEAHIDRLQDPQKLRGWLYALGRRECRRLLRGPDRPQQRRPAPETPDAFTDPEQRRRYYDARQLAHGALSKLSGRQREAVDLTIRHGLSDTELAGVLGMTLDEGGALAEGARDELAEAVAAIVGHDRIQLSKLMSVLPIAMAPPDLEQRILAGALDPQMKQDRAQIARRTAQFGPTGWPVDDEGRGHRATPRSATPQPRSATPTERSATTASHSPTPPRSVPAPRSATPPPRPASHSATPPPRAAATGSHTAAPPPRPATTHSAAPPPRPATTGSHTAAPPPRSAAAGPAAPPPRSAAGSRSAGPAAARTTVMPAPRVERFEPETEGRKLPPAMIPLLGVAGVAVLVGGLFFVVPDDDGGRPQATDTTVSPSPEPSSSSAGASDKPKKPAKSPKTSTTPSQEPSAKPSTATPSSKPTTVKPPPKPKPGTALVKGCSIVFPATACTATITAKGGPVVWAAEAGGLLYGGGGGKLTAGQTANVTVSIERADPCEAGSDPLVFTPGGSVTVSWTCPEAEPEQPPEDPEPAAP